MIARRFSRFLATDAASSDPVLVTRVSSGVVQVTLNRPEKLNALTVDMGVRLHDLVAELRNDAGIRAVVLTGAGRAFSAGGDLHFLHDRQRNHRDVEANFAAMRRFYSLFLSIRSLPVPVIAAVNGSAVGAGCCLAGAADLRVVARGAKIGVNFTRLGISPGMAGTHFLPQVFGGQFASWLMLSGDLVSAEDAHANGFSLALLDTPQAAVDEAVRRALVIAAASPIAVRQTIRSLRLRSSDGVEASLTREADAQSHCFGHPDFVEGLRAIEEKTPPKF